MRLPVWVSSGKLADLARARQHSYHVPERFLGFGGNKKFDRWRKTQFVNKPIWMRPFSQHFPTIGYSLLCANIRQHQKNLNNKYFRLLLKNSCFDHFCAFWEHYTSIIYMTSFRIAFFSRRPTVPKTVFLLCGLKMGRMATVGTNRP